ncbi:c-type cytochrome biogenesis protein CcmI [Pusillimonas sp. MFBS29]|uniref:c-type cytochrome biogenesis protein CcmI n=1 Tax=Pusillimonas sp. MFBS29 TaxID=2886690 RepID=UPI001D127FF1|nr:c-type cytochrome biogenesis protein CcmI [Pusillimonas sp. MFBS29]MCC2597743.1 c-type cytochrome biogenesis protein CcmI [Pusillimonas sp. MFBS29]
MNFIFILIAALLAASVTLWLGLALWRGPKLDSSLEHHAVNARVLRDQLAELEQDRANGILSLHDHAAAQQDLQRRVLDEAIPTKDTGLWRQSSKPAAITLAIVLPVAATLSYLALGNPAAITPPPAQSIPAMTQADVQAMVDSLAARLARNPDDPTGWLMLGRSYRYFEKYEDAAAAFSKAATVIQSDPLALSEYAETLARSNQAGFKGEPTQLLERALSLNPREPFALTLAGAAALERQDYPAAIDYWQQLFELLPPDSDAAQAVENTIKRARREQAEAVTSEN